MARWIGVGGFGQAGPASYLSSTGAFLAVVVCVLAVVTVVAALCAKHSGRESKNRSSSSGAVGPTESPARSPSNFKLAPKSPGRAIRNTLSTKKLMITRKWGRDEEEEMKARDRAALEKGDFVWQRSILMGERCQPLDFPGVIIYDHMGNRLSEFPPRSPRLNVFHPSIQVKQIF